MTKQYIKNLSKKYADHFNDKAYVNSFLVGLALFAASLVVNFYATTYATEVASNYVTDIVLSNTRVFDVDGLFVYGPVFMWVFVILLLLHWPKKINFAIKSIALFVLIRSVFIATTHLGPFPTQMKIDNLSILSKLVNGEDYFFSAHTGLPFLLALLFWDDIYLRILFIFASVFFGAVVLLGHLHYSIDVLSAFFITYTIYRIAASLFKKDCIDFHDETENININEKEN